MTWFLLSKCSLWRQLSTFETQQNNRCISITLHNYFRYITITWTSMVLNPKYERELAFPGCPTRMNRLLGAGVDDAPAFQDNLVSHLSFLFPSTGSRVHPREGEESREEVGRKSIWPRRLEHTDSWSTGLVTQGCIPFYPGVTCFGRGTGGQIWCCFM